MEKEIWKDVVNYDGYKVSNLGNVMSVGRIIINSDKSKRVIKSRILKTSKSRGYFIVSLYKNCKARSFSVHQLMAVCFLNHEFGLKNKFVVNHIDGNKLNNNISNLEIVTNRENTSICKRNVIRKCD